MAEEKYLARYEKSADGNYLKASRGILDETVTTTADVTLNQEQSGCVVFLNGAVTHDVTLPAPLAGLKFRFVCKDSTAVVDIVEGSSGNLIGSVVDIAGTGDTAVSGDTKIIFDTTAVPGDYVDVVCDGSDWYVSGLCSAADAVLFG